MRVGEENCIPPATRFCFTRDIFSTCLFPPKKTCLDYCSEEFKFMACIHKLRKAENLGPLSRESNNHCGNWGVQHDERAKSVGWVADRNAGGSHGTWRWAGFRRFAANRRKVACRVRRRTFLSGLRLQYELVCFFFLTCCQFVAYCCSFLSLPPIKDGLQE